TASAGVRREARLNSRLADDRTLGAFDPSPRRPSSRRRHAKSPPGDRTGACKLGAWAVGVRMHVRIALGDEPRKTEQSLTARRAWSLGARADLQRHPQ